jgi:hypothetical protein
MERLQSFVGGRWVDGGGTPVVLTNPATEEPVAEVRNGFDAQGALTHARAAGAGVAPNAFVFEIRLVLLGAGHNSTPIMA